jgi:DNA replication protein DnaC
MHAIKEILEKQQISKSVIQPEDYAQYRVDEFNKLKGNLNEKDGYNCDKCHNKGNIIYLKDGYEYSRACECMEIRRSIKNMERSGLKEVIKKFTLSKYETTLDWQNVVKQSAIDYINQKENFWWFIGGQSGAGKTMICTAIAKEFLLKGQKVKYMLWKEDATKIKASITDKAVYESLLNPFKKAEILYIDDFFKPIKGNDGNLIPPTQADVNLAFEIIDYRKSADLRTIISSERYFSEIIDIDEATAGRIAEQTTKKFLLAIRRSIRNNYRFKGLDL